MTDSMRILDIPKRADPRHLADMAERGWPYISHCTDHRSSPRQRGVAGIVIWGAIRDSAEIGAGTYPVYASGVTHRGPYKNGPGEINVPVNMGGMAINPGDIIVGDADGLVAIPQEQAEHILKSAQAILAKETKGIKEIEAGTVDRSWVDKSLKEKGYKLP